MFFPPENSIRYSQDFTEKSGIPDDVDFSIARVDSETVKLTAPGYGGKPYGNGSLFIHKGLAPNCGLFNLDEY